MTEQQQHAAESEAAPLSRKTFLSISGKSLVAGGLLAGSPLLAQTRSDKAAKSPPARIPASPQEPIVLEQWKSDADPATAPTPTPLAPDQRVGYAVVGLGHLALEEILPALSSCKKSRLVALVSGNPEKLKKVSGQYGIARENCYSYQNFDSISSNKLVDVVYIVLPNGLHKEYVIRAAKAGKHVLCEKPMANNAEECRDMIRACEQANVKLMIAYRIQYQPHNRYVRQQLKQQEFGTTRFVEACNSQSSANPDHWRHKKALAGGGALPDIGLYCLNTTRFILGLEPTEVFAWQFSTAGNPLFKEVEELVAWQMKFPGGIMASCSTDYAVHESRRYRVMAERGWLDIENAYAYHGQQLKSSTVKDGIKMQASINIPETNQFAAEMDHFSDCVMNNKQPFTTGYEGLQDHIIMDAIYQSAREGRPVKIDPVKDPSKLHGPEPEL
ncbi:MAG: Gfo/Idh/MocA family oxidoreductase [Chitinophagaceae bacterium]|nr:MAG: Gfo/Idh/MocA family oxidoreductase [Chitinophagaceae bacterium]